MDSLLDLDHSELESHLFSHLSELGRRDEEGSVETEEDVDIQEYQTRSQSLRKREKVAAAVAENRSATKTGHLLGDLGSRGRPRKSHEPVPFLSIDNMPRSKCPQLDPIDAARQVSFISNPHVPFNTPSRCSFRQLASRTSTAPTMSVGSTEWNSLVPKRHRGKVKGEVPTVNLMVQAPFKHSVNKTPRMRRAPSPSNILKERTNLATYQVAKVIAKQRNPKQSQSGSGKLLKAKLKPMYPVAVDGPTIEKCRGIRPEPKKLDVGASNTVQRRRQIMYTLTHEYGSDKGVVEERPRTVESVHQTSVVSDLSTDRMLDLKEELEEVEEMRRDRSLPMEGTPKIPPNSVASLSESPLKIQVGKDIEDNPRTPMKSEAAVSTRCDKSDLESVSVVNTPLDSTRNRSMMESGPYSVGEVPEDLRNDELQCTSVPPTADTAEPHRPHTAADSEGRKVRFADEGGSQRSQSAVARLHTPASSRKSSAAAAGNKADILVVDTPPAASVSGSVTVKTAVSSNAENNPAPNGTHTSQTESKDVAKIDETAARHSGDVTENLNNNDSEGDNTNNNNFEGNKQVLKVKVKDVAKGFKKRPKSAPVRKVRPRSAQIRNKLGTWEDRMKPEGNIEDLNVCGKSTEFNNDMALIEYYGERSASGTTFKPGRTCGRIARPLSAGHKGFRLEEKRRIIARARPQSASVYLNQDYFSVESRGARMFEPDENEIRMRFGVTNSSRAVISPVITYQNPPHFRRRSKRRAQRKTRPRLYLSDLARHGKARVCAQCGEGSFCYADLEDEGVICEHCALGRDSEEDEDDSLSAQAEYGNDIDVSYEEDFAETQDERFESLENSLAQIQSEIGRCIDGGSESPFQSPAFLQSVLSLDAEEYNIKDGGLTAYDVIDTALKKQEREGASRDRVLSGMLSDYVTDAEKHKEYQKRRKGQGRFYDTTRDDLDEGEDGLDLERSPTQDRFALALIEEETTARSEHGAKEAEKEDESMSVREHSGLEVKARAKTLIRPRSASGAQEPLCPYPPLCFSINARPPEGYCYYFAYGIDMNPHRFSTYVKRENVDRFWGLLFGFQLKFNKKGEDEEAGCFPNIEYSQNSSVEGAVYMVKSEEMALVDQCMGYPQYVEKVVVPVWFMNCPEPDELGVAQYCVAAAVYIARDEWTVQDCSELANEYAVSQCIKSADLLSPAYKEYLISQVN